MQSPQIPFQLDAIRKLALANGWKLLDMSSFIGAMRDFGCAPPKEFHVDDKGKFTAISYDRDWWHWWTDKDAKMKGGTREIGPAIKIMDFLNELVMFSHFDVTGAEGRARLQVPWWLLNEGDILRELKEKTTPLYETPPQKATELLLQGLFAKRFRQVDLSVLCPPDPSAAEVSFETCGFFLNKSRTHTFIWSCLLYTSDAADE